ncbi:histidine phosphatase family protein [Nocardia sp. 2YAB30]|uniref:histidine phosphatase family protein n=1 Tax=Nocardia sp. 2YAB30 TaxID=3233022 RepID=UPI003F9A9A3B
MVFGEPKSTPGEDVLSSGLGRARQTAEAIARVTAMDPQQVTISSGPREGFPGSLEGCTRAQGAIASPNGYARWQAGDIGSFDGREGLVAVARRAVPVLLAHSLGRARSTGRLVVVTHANTTLALVGSLAGVSA